MKTDDLTIGLLTTEVRLDNGVAWLVREVPDGAFLVALREGHSIAGVVTPVACRALAARLLAAADEALPS